MGDKTGLRVLYVEDDPALRGILGTLLTGHPEILLVASFDNSAEALDYCHEGEIDVALLDLALGNSDMSGIELGIAIRRLQPGAGVVMLSQHSVPGFLARLDDGQRKGWSFILKRADLHPRYLADVLIATARGLNIVDPHMLTPDSNSDSERLILETLTSRQRLIMSLVAQGLDAPSIAGQLNISSASVRQDLSRAYQVLVPDPPAGADLRTLALLRYMKEMRSFDPGARQGSES